MRDVGVIYLYRFAEGEEPVHRFLETYCRHQAGTDHDLYVLFKGFPTAESLCQARELFANVPVQSLELDDFGYDIGAYVKAARIVPNRRLLFLNTFSRILADNWLHVFDQALSQPNVGIVGATGSWAANTAGPESSFIFILRRMFGWPARLYQSSERRQLDDCCSSLGIRGALKYYCSAPLDYAVRFYRYGRYPNPHLRTNAFMIDRRLFLSLTMPKFATKSDAHMFESGRRSMTRQILQKNLRAVIVDRTGKVYDAFAWKSSLTFRIGQQQNLLIGDNRTVDFDEASPAHRQYLERLSWVHPWQWDRYTSR